MAEQQLMSDDDVGLMSDEDVGIDSQQQAPSAQAAGADQPMSDADVGLMSDEDVGLDKPDSSALGTFARDVSKSAVPLVGMLAGAGRGAQLGAAIGTGIEPGGGTLVGGLLGGVAGAFAGSYWGNMAQDYVLDKMGLKKGGGWFSDEQAAADQEQHPWAKRAADVAETAAAFSVNPAATLAQRGLSAGLNTAFEAGQEAYHGEFSPTDLALKAAEGFALPGQRKWAGAVHGFGERFGSQMDKPAMDAATRARNAMRTQDGAQDHADVDAANDLDTVSGNRAQENPPPPQGVDVGDPQNKVERNDEDYSKKGQATSSPNMTQGIIDPALMAALANEDPRYRQAPEAPEGSPVDTGLADVAKQQQAQAPQPDLTATVNPEPKPMSDNEVGVSTGPVDEAQGMQYPHPSVEGMTIDRSNPVEGGVSHDTATNTLNVDQGMPHLIQVGERTLDPAVALGVRAHALDMAKKAQDSVASQHNLPEPILERLRQESANVIEENWAKAHGYDPDAYREAMKPFTPDRGPPLTEAELQRSPQPVNPEVDETTGSVNPQVDNTDALQKLLQNPKALIEAAKAQGMTPAQFREAITQMRERPAEAQAPQSKLVGKVLSDLRAQGMHDTADMLESHPDAAQREQMAANINAELNSKTESRAQGPKEYARTRIRSTPKADNGTEARTKAQADKINRSLAAAEEGFKKRHGEDDETNQETKQRVKEGLEKSRAANQGQLPHQTYMPTKARSKSPVPPTAAWLWNRAGDLMLRGKMGVTKFRGIEEQLKAGSPEDIRAVMDDLKIEAPQLDRGTGDAGVAAAENRSAAERVYEPNDTSEFEDMGREHAKNILDTKGNYESGEDNLRQTMNDEYPSHTREQFEAALDAYREHIQQYEASTRGEGAIDLTNFTEANENKVRDQQAQLAQNLIKLHDTPQKTARDARLQEQEERMQRTGQGDRAKEAAALMGRTLEPEVRKNADAVKKQITPELAAHALAALEKAKARNTTAEHVVSRNLEAEADALLNAAGDVNVTATVKPEALKSKVTDNVKKLLGDESGAVDINKLNGVLKARKAQLYEAWTKVFGDPKKALNKYFGIEFDNYQRHAGAILRGIMSMQSKLTAEMVRTTDAHYYRWLKTKPADTMTYLHALETVPEKASRADFVKFLTDAKIDPKTADWMADERDFHIPIMQMIYDNDKKFGMDYEREANYVARQFADPKGAREFIDQYRKTLGATGYTKERVFESIREAEKAGFKLRHTNPIDIMHDRWQQSIRNWTLLTALDRLKNQGMAFEAKDKPDWAKNFVNVSHTPDGKQWAVTPEIANLWKNALDHSSIMDRDDALGGAARTWLKVKQVWMPLQLGLSLFHEVHVVGNINPVQNFVRAARIGMKTGDWMGEFKKALQYSTSDVLFATPFDKIGGGVGPFLDRLAGKRFSTFEGRQLMENWRTDSAKLSPVDRAMQQLIQETGAQLAQPHEDTISANKAWAKAVAANDWPGMVGAGVRRGVQFTQDWMMKYQIPAIKAVAIKRDIEAAFRIDPTLATNAAKRKLVLSEIGKNIDDRFGEMFYKGLFWNRYMKDAGIMSFLSLSWNVGQFRQFTGGIHDAYDFAKMKSGLGQQPQYTRQTQVLNSDRAAFVGGYIAMSMAAAGMMSWALSGTFPTGLDYFYPKNGENNPDGTPARLSVPFNTREGPMLLGHISEANSLLGGIWHTLYNKMILSPLVEAFQNKDFFGNEMFDPNAPAWKRAVQLLDAEVGEHASPIATSGAKRAGELGGGFRDKALAFAGFGPAPAYVSHTDMENKIANFYYDSHGTHPYEYGSKTGLGRGLVQGTIRSLAGDPTQSEGKKQGYAEINRGTATGDKDLTNQGRRDLVNLGGMSGRTAGRTNPDQQFQRMFKDLPQARQVALYKQMSDEEKMKYVLRNPLMSGKNKGIVIGRINPQRLP